MKTTKTTKTAKTSKASKTVRSERVSSLEYTFLKSPTEMPTDETIAAVVLAAMRKVKKGTLAEVAETAARLGFTKISDQDVVAKTRIFLRRLANDGVVKITRNGDEVKAKSAKKTAKKDGKKKSFKLVKK